MSVILSLLELVGGPGVLVGLGTTIAALIWGLLGRGKARREGAKKERDRIAHKITEANHETAEDIQRALASHPADRDRARERLRRRLEADD